MSNKDKNQDNKITKLDTTLSMFMEQTKQELKEIKSGIQKIFDKLDNKDKEYNDKFATKEEVKKMETNKITRHPIFVSVVSGLIFALLIIALKNLGQL